MAFYPKIQNPCPYQGQLAAIIDGDMCRMCQRQVFDLTHMDDEARRAFFRGCTEEVCVSYAVRLKPALAAAAMAAALGAPGAAFAADAPAVNMEVETIWVTGGGIKDPANVEHDADLADQSVPELPVVYEEDSAGAPAAGTSAGEPAARSGSVSRPSGA